MTPGIKRLAFGAHLGRRASSSTSASSTGSRPRLVVMDKLTNLPVTHYYDDAALSWSDCLDIVNTGAIHRLNRSESELVRYKAWGTQIRQSFASMEDFILKTVFVPPPTGTGGHGGHAPKLVLRANDFPYNLHPSIEHWVLWADRKLAHHQIKAVVHEWLVKVEHECKVELVHYPKDQDAILSMAPTFETNPHATSAADLEHINLPSSSPLLPEWVYWVNPPERQTIPGVWHAHILVNRE